MSEVNFKTKKSLGQHFLKNDFIPKKMCSAANLKPDDTVIEIGPGTGILTAEILKTAGKVIALESDLRAIEILKEKFIKEISNNRLSVLKYDVRNFNINDIVKNETEKFKIVSNIPYYLTGILFRKTLDNRRQPQIMVFLIQKEVAERISKADKESLLSLSIKAFGSPKYISTVKRNHFTPPPKVDSAILAIDKISCNNFKSFSSHFFFSCLKLGFSQKRKQLLGNLTKMYARYELYKIFEELEIPTKIRAEDLSMEQWLLLTKYLVKLKRKY